MANYVSQYTGAQIDEYLGKAAISVPNKNYSIIIIRITYAYIYT